LRDRNPPGKSVLDYQNNTGANEVGGSEGRRSKWQARGQPRGLGFRRFQNAFFGFFAVFGGLKSRRHIIYYMYMVTNW
jgi:hypothetical protein